MFYYIKVLNKIIKINYINNFYIQKFMEGYYLTLKPPLIPQGVIEILNLKVGN
jgi:hypothetical protein